MPLVTSKELVSPALTEHYAVGAFNTIDMETSQAIHAAATDERAPLIFQITQTTLKYTGPEVLAAMLKQMVADSDLPIALHLDHGRTFDIAMRFIRLGFTSVMIDGSLQPDGKTSTTYEENVAITRKVVEAAHAVGVTVEGEIGRIGQVASETDPSKMLTDPDEAARFVEDTGVDLLAVAIGTAHGVYKGTPFIDLERVKAIHEKVSVPLVMHGGSFTPDESIRAAIRAGIAKVNIDTDMRVAFFEAANGYIRRMNAEHEEADRKGEPRKYDIRKLLGETRDAMGERVADRIRLFGCSGKAGAGCP